MAISWLLPQNGRFLQELGHMHNQVAWTTWAQYIRSIANRLCCHLKAKQKYHYAKASEFKGINIELNYIPFPACIDRKKLIESQLNKIHINQLIANTMITTKKIQSLGTSNKLIFETAFKKAR